MREEEEARIRAEWEKAEEQRAEKEAEEAKILLDELDTIDEDDFQES